MRLENWYKDTVVTDTLKGNVFGHPKHEDGTHIRTSSVAGVTPDGRVVTISGSEYELGEPEAEYAERYPDARPRILASIRKEFGEVGSS